MTTDIDDAEMPEEGSEPKDAAASAEIDPASLEARKKAVLEQKQYVTGRIGETCRFIVPLVV